MIERSFAPALALLVTASLTLVPACGDSGFEFRARYAPEYARGGTVSVLGVFKDGRMDPDAWGEVRATLLPVRGCEAGYSPGFVAENPALSAAVDDYAKKNGVSDELLEQIAPLAKADAILLVSIAGRPPQQTGPSIRVPKPVNPGQKYKPASTYSTITPTDGSIFVVSASLFSVPRRRSVARLSMTYGGQDVAGALRAFAERFATEMPVTACAGWAADAHGVDEAKIRGLADGPGVAP